MSTRKNHLTTLLLGLSLIGTLHAGTRLSCQGGGDVKILLLNGDEIRTSYRKISDPYIRLFAGKRFRFDLNRMKDGYIVATIDGRKFRFVDKAAGRVAKHYVIDFFGFESEDDPRDIRLIRDLQSGQWHGDIFNDTLMISYHFECQKL